MALRDPRQLARSLMEGQSDLSGEDDAADEYDSDDSFLASSDSSNARAAPSGAERFYGADRHRKWRVRKRDMRHASCNFGPVSVVEEPEAELGSGVFDGISTWESLGTDAVLRNFVREDDDDPPPPSSGRKRKSRVKAARRPKEGADCGRSYSWCITSFSPVKPCAVKLRKMTGGSFSCFGGSPEVCPTTGRKHWQMFIRFSSACSLKAASKKIALASAYVNDAGETTQSLPSLRVMHGTLAQNAIYCGKAAWVNELTGRQKAKNKDYFEYGTVPSDVTKKGAQGARTDIVEHVRRITAGETTVDEMTIDGNAWASHQYGRTLDRAEAIRHRKLYRTWMTQTVWLWGDTGVGKSHVAFTNYDPATTFVWKEDGGWQDDYVLQPNIIMNDFRGAIKYGTLLQLLDKWAYSIRRRGAATMPWLAKRVIITSSMCPSDVYCNLAEADGLEQLLRRLTVIKMTVEDRALRRYPIMPWAADSNFGVNTGVIVPETDSENST